MPPPRYEVIGIAGLPEIRMGDDLARLVVDAARAQGTPISAGDLLVLSQKIVSKAEGRVVKLSDVKPSARAEELATSLGKDPRVVEIILRETRRVVRQGLGLLIVETHHGFVCANAGVDQSNVDAEEACLLPEDADRSARELVARVRELTGLGVAMIVADTFGRPWREGLVNVAVGVAGFDPMRSYLGDQDPGGHVLQATVLALADELASAAEPVMGKLDRVPAAIVRGLQWEPSEATSRALVRDPARDLFR